MTGEIARPHAGAADLMQPGHHQRGAVTAGCRDGANDPAQMFHDQVAALIDLARVDPLCQPPYTS